MIYSQVSGIFQSDILIKTAIELAINDLRKNPWLLDYCFNGIPQDLITQNLYGDSEVRRAKEWFLKTDIPVSMNYRIDAPKLPIISLELSSSTEAEATLGDVHSVPTESVDATGFGAFPSQVIIGPFTPQDYDIATGLVTLPQALATDAIVPGMAIMSTVTNQAFAILSVQSQTQFTIHPNPVNTFQNATIVPASTLFVEHMESCLYKEVYRVGVHVSGEPVHLTYLYSIIMFILLRYKQEYLEKRGFERTILQAGTFEDNALTEKEVVWSRYINISGFVKHIWPKLIAPEIQGVEAYGFSILGGGKSPLAILPQVESQSWRMEFDPIKPLNINIKFPNTR